jgi:methyl-accepting chemotaxis protein
LLKRTNEQAASLEEITSSIEELSENIETNLANTEQSNQHQKKLKPVWKN